MNIEKRMEIERKVVRHLIRTMKKNDWKIVAAHDGGDDFFPITTETEAMDAVFSVDESCLRFRKELKRHTVFIVLGNSGWDCIADYSYSTTDDFKDVMEKYVDPYCEKLEEL